MLSSADAASMKHEWDQCRDPTGRAAPPRDVAVSEDPGRGLLPPTRSAKAQHAVVKNTFVEVVDSSDEYLLPRSRSESDLSKSSHTPCNQLDDFPAFWLPSQLSNSSSSSFMQSSHQLGSGSRPGSQGGGSDRERDRDRDLDRGGRSRWQVAGLSQSHSNRMMSPMGTSTNYTMNCEHEGDGFANFRDIIDSIWNNGAQGGDESGAGMKAGGKIAPPNVMPAGLMRSPWPDDEASCEPGSLPERASKEFPNLAVPIIMELDKAGLLAQVPRNQAGALTSVGSIGHENGTCRPCAYWFKGICARDIVCMHCHLTHEGQKSKRLRPSKQARARMRARKAEFMKDQANSDDELHDWAPHEEDEIPDVVPVQEARTPGAEWGPPLRRADGAFVVSL